jgi:transcriptional regulator GlxA family with amidase domain
VQPGVSRGERAVSCEGKRLRLEAARLMLEESRHTIDQVADATGFSDPWRMRDVFMRAFGLPPHVFRRNARMSSESM